MDKRTEATLKRLGGQNGWASSEQTHLSWPLCRSGRELASPHLAGQDGMVLSLPLDRVSPWYVQHEGSAVGLNKRCVTPDSFRTGEGSCKFYTCLLSTQVCIRQPHSAGIEQAENSSVPTTSYQTPISCPSLVSMGQLPGRGRLARPGHSMGRRGLGHTHPDPAHEEDPSGLYVQLP